MKKSKEAIKHLAILSGEISPLERKIFTVLLAWASNDLKKQETHEISIKDLAHFIGLNSNHYELLKKSLRTLNVTSVKWDYLDKDKDVWESSTLLSGVQIINDVCIYGYSFVMRERLGDINKMFDRIAIDSDFTWYVPVIENQKLFNILNIEFGISGNKIIEIMETKDESYIEEVLEIVREAIKAGKVKNIPAFTIKAIEDDYR